MAAPLSVYLLARTLHLPMYAGGQYYGARILPALALVEYKAGPATTATQDMANFLNIFRLDSAVEVAVKTSDINIARGLIGLLIPGSANSRYHNIDTSAQSRLSKLRISKKVGENVVEYVVLNDSGLNVRADAQVTSIGNSQSASGTPTASDIVLYISLSSSYYNTTTKFKVRVWSEDGSGNLTSGGYYIAETTLALPVAAKGSLSVTFQAANLFSFVAGAYIKAQAVAYNEEGYIDITTTGVASSQGAMGRQQLSGYNFYAVVLSAQPTTGQLNAAKTYGQAITVYYDRYSNDATFAPFPNPSSGVSALLYAAATGSTLSGYGIYYNPSEDSQSSQYLKYYKYYAFNSSGVFTAGFHIISLITFNIANMDASPKWISAYRNNEVFTASVGLAGSYGYIDGVLTIYATFSLYGESYDSMNNTNYLTVQNWNNAYVYLIGNSNCAAFKLAYSTGTLFWYTVSNSFTVNIGKNVSLTKLIAEHYYILIGSTPLQVGDTTYKTEGGNLVAIGTVTEIIDLTV